MKQIRILRKYNKDKYCIGDFFKDGIKQCNTLEDKDRGLAQSMLLEEINKYKIYGKTAIPVGKYIVKFDVVPTWSSMRKFTICKKYGYRFPSIRNVKGYSGVYIHNGKDHDDTLGCPLLGLNSKIGQLTDGINQMDIFMQWAKENNYEDVELTIERAYELDINK